MHRVRELSGIEFGAKEPIPDPSIKSRWGWGGEIMGGEYFSAQDERVLLTECVSGVGVFLITMGFHSLQDALLGQWTCRANEHVYSTIPKGLIKIEYPSARPRKASWRYCGVVSMSCKRIKFQKLS